MKKRVHGHRTLLNPPGFHSTAAIVAEVEDTTTWKAGCSQDGTEITHQYDIVPDYTFQISDCDRKVSFEIDFTTKAGRKASLVKVDRMIDALIRFRAGLTEEFDRYEWRKKEHGF